MIQNACRSVCRYYHADSTFRNSKVDIFRKHCPTCNLTLISKYSRCPCCHSMYGNGEY